jgi:glycosyltransferase involved in cell wall biosynthesis
MRIAFLNPCGQMGGAETSLQELLESLRRAEPDWELYLVLGEDGPLAAKAERLGVKVKVVLFPPALAKIGDSGSRSRLRLLWPLLASSAVGAEYTRRLRQALQELQPDIIHTNGFKMHVVGLWARSGGTPVVWHIRDYISSRPAMKLLLRTHSRFCTAAVANSESVVRDIRSVCGPGLETHCVYNAVDLTKYSPDGGKADLDGLAGLNPAPPGTVRIGLIATLARWKGHEVFLKALTKLSSGLKYRAFVIGGPIYQTLNSQWTLEELKGMAAQLGVEAKVGFTGFVSNPASAIRALDVVVHASTEPEPFGRVIAEAMACGRAVISSATGGADELITEGHNALVHTPGDPASLALSMEKLVRESDLRQRLGCAGRATAERRFASSRLAAELVPIYRRALNGPISGPPIHSGA